MPVKFFFYTIFALILSCMFVAGCGRDDSADYEGVGKLVSERNRARMAKHAAKQRKTDAGTPVSEPVRVKAPSGKTLSGEGVKVVSLSSGKVLATGMAYLDEDGNIVTIRIKK
ncbi:MAG: hypothetical protein GY737_03440 [Desulfobacteraceae bacterium]|nr:hypothetical protein [Desulfobacteraceae bacterium]